MFDLCVFSCNDTVQLRFLMGVIVTVTLDFMIDVAEVMAVTKIIHVSLKYMYK